MQKNRLQKKSFYLSLVLTLFVCILFFQNCSQTGLEDQQSESASSSEESSYVSDKNPFAFAISVDHLALMTCPTGNQKNIGSFSFKWGAYRNGLVERPSAGISLTSEFLALHGQKVDSKKFDEILASPKNSGLHIVSAFYDQSNFSQAQQYNFIEDGLVNQTSRYAVNRYLQEIILKSEQGAHYFSDIGLEQGASRLLESSLYRASFSNYSNALNDEFSSVLEGSIRTKDLVLGFAHADKLSGGYPLISADGSYSAQTAVGTAYTFSYGRVGNFDRYLTSVNERNLIDSRSTQGNGWQCASNMRFKIVQRADLGKTGVNCSPNPIDPRFLSSQTSLGRRLRSIANVVDFSEWEIDLGGQCIVRKQRSPSDPCYDKTYYGYTNSSGFKQTYTDLVVDYQESDCINEPYKKYEGGGRTIEQYRVCPHYVSICVKVF